MVWLESDESVDGKVTIDGEDGFGKNVWIVKAGVDSEK